MATKVLLEGHADILAHEESIFKVASAFTNVLGIMEADNEEKEKIVRCFVGYCSPRDQATGDQTS